MEGRRPRKKRLRAVLLVSAVGATACGGRAESSEGDGSHRTGPVTSGDGDGFMGDVVTDPWQSTGDVRVGDVGMDDDCCVDQPVGGGAGNDDVGEVLGAGAGNYDEGGAGGENAGSNDYVGIR